jgi:hypothetical protein
MQEKYMQRQQWVMGVPALAACLVGLALAGMSDRSGAADAANLMTIQKSGLVFNSTTSTYDTIVTLSNERSTPLLEPFKLIVSIDTPQVSLMNASGITKNGLPYIQIPLPGGSLDQGQSVLALLKFRNPQQVEFNVLFEVDVQLPETENLLPYPGPGGAATSLGVN